MSFRGITSISFVCVLLIISACGWQLRGLEKTSNTVTSPAASAHKIDPQNPTSVRPVKSTEDAGSSSNIDHAKPGNDKLTIRLVMLERNHGLAAALNRVAWENKQQFSDTGHTWLVIEKEKLEKRPLTVTETGVAAQYQLLLTINFSQKNSNDDSVGEVQQIVSWRSYDFDPKLIVAKTQEEEALIVEMREELSRRMLSLIK